MKKIQVFILLAVWCSIVQAQSSAIFNGGPADGFDRTAFQQASNNIFNGGIGDGTDRTAFAQTSNNIFTGGNGNGWNMAGFSQAVNNIFTGGNGDGWSMTGFSQAINNIFNGGNGDGWNGTSFAQGGNNIFPGGAGDGWNSTSFAQGGNNIFPGGVGDGWASAYRPMGPLPVTLLFFNARKYTATSSFLDWQTSQEVNSARFEVERSVDAVVFSRIGSVQAAGNSSIPVGYNFIDNNPVKGMNYYRLKQVDADGRFVYTPARSVRFDELNPGTVKYYPNPTNGILTIELSAANSNEVQVINIINVSGAVVNQLRIAPSAGTNMQIDLSRYSKGTYFIQLRTATLNSTQRIILE
ncbi:MAG: T9SS type A sorting domain-containing protein [Ferruginibacter sp.]